MLVDLISDLHGFKPKLPGGDVLIICGDLTARDRKEEYDQFTTWLSDLPYRCKIVIAGNHDGLIEKGKAMIGNDHGIHYLCDSGLEFEGLRIWGSPYTPVFLDWFFMEERGKDIRRHWDLIPNGIDILVTHGPPHGILDKTEDNFQVGCEDLKKIVLERVKPRIHCFGHIHECGGRSIEVEGTTFVNCSYVNERYRPVHSSIRMVL